jgi:hypothetical protein
VPLMEGITVPERLAIAVGSETRKYHLPLSQPCLIMRIRC